MAEKTATTEQRNGRIQFLLPVALGFLLMAVSVLTVGNQYLYALLGNVGLLLYLLAGRNAENRKEFVRLYLFVWLGLGIRWCTFFGDLFPYVLIIPACMLLYALAVVLLLALDAHFIRKGLWATLIFPLSYTLLNLIVVDLNLGDLQNLPLCLACLPVLSQNSVYLGEYGFTFVLSLLLSLAAYALMREQKERRGKLLIAVALVFAALLGFGTIRMARAEEADYSLHVAVAIAEENDYVGNGDIDPTKEVQLEKLRNALDTAANNGAELFITHEEYYTLLCEDEDWAMEELSSLVKSYGIPSLICIEQWMGEGEKAENKAVFFDADGQLLCSYYKNNLVPFVESPSYVDGEQEAGVFHCEVGGHDLNMALVICFDINDPVFISRIPDSTELLLVPSWDWNSVNLEQLRAYRRSIEQNTTVLKHSFEGFAYASGPYGVCGEILDNRGTYSTVQYLDVPIWEK